MPTDLFPALLVKFPVASVFLDFSLALQRFLTQSLLDEADARRKILF